MRSTKNFTEQGVTLVELMVALVVLAVLASAFVAGAGLVNRRYRLRAATRQVVSMINYARTQATVRKRIYRLRAGVGNHWPDGENLPSRCGTKPTSANGQGWIFVDEGETPRVSTAFKDLHTPVQQDGRCLKVFHYNQNFKDVEIYRAFLHDQQGNTIPTNQSTFIQLYFRPDGQVHHCTQTASGNAMTCSPASAFLCVRRLLPAASTQNGSPRLVHIAFNGIIRTTTNSTQCP